MELKTGIRGYAEVTVDSTNTAASVGSGLLDVYSTPAMIALIENAAQESVRDCLAEGQGTVGMRLEVDHLAPVPVGYMVRAETELTEISGRVLTFRAEVFSEKEKIGEGIHKRCIIDTERFLNRMNSKYN